MECSQRQRQMSRIIPNSLPHCELSSHYPRKRRRVSTMTNEIFLDVSCDKTFTPLYRLRQFTALRYEQTTPPLETLCLSFRLTAQRRPIHPSPLTVNRSPFTSAHGAIHRSSAAFTALKALCQIKVFFHK